MPKVAKKEPVRIEPEFIHRRLLADREMFLRYGVSFGSAKLAEFDMSYMLDHKAILDYTGNDAVDDDGNEYEYKTASLDNSCGDVNFSLGRVTEKLKERLLHTRVVYFGLRYMCAIREIFSVSAARIVSSMEEYEKRQAERGKDPAVFNLSLSKMKSLSTKRVCYRDTSDLAMGIYDKVYYEPSISNGGASGDISPVP